MRLAFFIILISFSSSYAIREIPNLVIETSHNFTPSDFKKKKHSKRHFVKIRKRLNQQASKKLSTIIPNNKGRTKGKAILMAILTGPIGGHRLYLGTKPYIPIVYALTLGGGLGFLPAIDIIVILFTKDLNKYYDNPQIMMW